MSFFVRRSPLLSIFVFSVLACLTQLSYAAKDLSRIVPLSTPLPENRFLPKLVDGFAQKGFKQSTENKTWKFEQSSDRVKADFATFDIAEDHMVSVGRAHDVNKDKALYTLFNVTGKQESQLLGTLKVDPNLHLALSNSNGIFAGERAVFNASKLMMTTGKINFDTEGALYSFSKTNNPSGGERTGRIDIAKGAEFHINADGGYLFLLGSHVVNEGKIIVEEGKKASIGLAAGAQFAMKTDEEGLIYVNVTQGTENAAVYHKETGSIVNNGGRTSFDAKGNHSVVNVEGAIDATSLVEIDGKIYLSGKSTEEKERIKLILSEEKQADSFKVTPSRVIVSSGEENDLGEVTFEPVSLKADRANIEISAGTTITLGQLVDEQVIESQEGDWYSVNTPGYFDLSVSASTVTPKGAIYARSFSLHKGIWNQLVERKDQLFPFSAPGDFRIAEGAMFNRGVKEGKEIVLYDVYGLQGMGQGKEYALGGDIDAIRTVPWNAGKGFNPISNINQNFDGRNHAITGLYIYRPDEDNVGLAATARGMIFKNVDLENVRITGKESVGALFGKGEAVRVEHSIVDGRIEVSEGEHGAAGGMAGHVTGESFFSNVRSEANVKGKHAGGIVGYLTGSDKSVIKNAYASGEIASEDQGGFSGGIVGKIEQGTIDSSGSNATVRAHNAENAGAFAGFAHDAGGEKDGFYESFAIKNSLYNSEKAERSGQPKDVKIQPGKVWGSTSHESKVAAVKSSEFNQKIAEISSSKRDTFPASKNMKPNSSDLKSMTMEELQALDSSLKAKRIGDEHFNRAIDDIRVVAKEGRHLFS